MILKIRTMQVIVGVPIIAQFLLVINISEAAIFVSREQSFNAVANSSLRTCTLLSTLDFQTYSFRLQVNLIFRI